MKSKLKSEIAYACGMSRNTFGRRYALHKAEIVKLGVNPNARLLPPKAVRYILRQAGHRRRGLPLTSVGTFENFRYFSIGCISVRYDPPIKFYVFFLYNFLYTRGI